MHELNLNPDRILHPRPSPIAAAMYTLRDLDVDVIVLHGPSGCNFRAARLLEKDGITIVTTAMDQNDVIFGAESRLTQTLQRVGALFSPKLVGVIGTCCASIIGEDLERIVASSNISYETLVIQFDPCAQDNVEGAIKTLSAAHQKGMIGSLEYERQKKLLISANYDERNRGTAREEYLGMSCSSSIDDTAKDIKESLKKNKQIGVILNSKKETSYLYSDILIAIWQLRNAISSKSRIVFIANMDNEVGLPRIKKYATNILQSFKEQGVKIDYISGGPDEYPLAGKMAAEHIKNHHSDIDLLIVCGLPHMVPVESLAPTIAVATGTRALFALKQLGYRYVIGEEMAHYSVLGSGGVVPSELGTALRALCR